MTKMQACQICGNETMATEDEAKAAMAEMEAQGLKAMAICGLCTMRMTAAAEMSALFGIDFDVEKTAEAFRDFAGAEKDGSGHRRVLIQRLWAIVKSHGVDYTKTIVAEEHDPFTDDKITFERKVYDGQTVIECEGVVVERL